MKPANPPDTRTRLVAAMGDALQRRGLHGIGLSEILEQAEAPKGVLYHHFPGGKDALALAAIASALDAVCLALDKLLATTGDPLVALQAWISAATRRLAASGFAQGCPFATIALESTPDDVAIRAALSDAFVTLRARIAAALQRAGHPAAHAAGLAALIVAAYEGGLLQSRVAHSSEPMLLVSQSLGALLAPLPHA